MQGQKTKTHGVDRHACPDETTRLVPYTLVGTLKNLTRPSAEPKGKKATSQGIRLAQTMPSWQT